MKKIVNILRLAGIPLAFFLIITPSAMAILNTSMDLEEKVISVFNYGEVAIKPDGVSIFFRCASELFSTTKEAFSDCNAKIDESISVLNSLDLEIDSIEKTPIKFFFKKKSKYGISPNIPSHSADKKSQKKEQIINCIAVQDIQITLSNKTKDINKVFDDIILIEDEMLEKNMLPIEPNEFGRKGFAFLEHWFREKNNIEWFIKDKTALKKQALEIAITKARTKAEEIAKNLDKTIVGVHSVQYIDEKEKIIHIWNSLSPISLKETVETYNNIRYQLGIVVNFSFE